MRLPGVLWAGKSPASDDVEIREAADYGLDILIQGIYAPSLPAPALRCKKVAAGCRAFARNCIVGTLIKKFFRQIS